MKKKKLAIIGTSPIMILFYYRLCNYYDITIFDCKKTLGGAWSITNTNILNFSTHNNVIIPDDEREDNAVYKINDELKNYGCEIITPKHDDIPDYKFQIYYQSLLYKAKNIYIHNFDEFYKTFKKKKPKIKKTKVKNIIVKKNKLVVNNDSFDFAVLPSCFDIDNIFLSNKKIDYIVNKIKSSHISVILNNNIDTCTYTEDFDNIFDRGQIRVIGKYRVFTGRVRKRFKNFNLSYISEKSIFLDKYKRDIIYSKIKKYDHYNIDNNSLKVLKQKFKGTNLTILETRQFNHAYLKLYNVVEKFKRFA